jgi:hypothetical protein
MTLEPYYLGRLPRGARAQRENSVAQIPEWERRCDRPQPHVWLAAPSDEELLAGCGALRVPAEAVAEVVCADLGSARGFPL